MANGFDGEVIDLSDSLVLADHRALDNAVIELNSDDSGLIELDIENSVVGVELTRVRQPRKLAKKRPDSLAFYDKKKTKVIEITSSIPDKLKKIIAAEQKIKFGECPICFDELGKNPLASTNCGHVYCMKCIEQYLLFDKRCPTCRQRLKGKTSYHALYLNR